MSEFKRLRLQYKTLTKHHYNHILYWLYLLSQIRIRINPAILFQVHFLTLGTTAPVWICFLALFNQSSVIKNPVILAWRPTGFQVIVDNGRSDLIQVLEGVYDLHDDGASFFLWHEFVLLQVEVQVIALTVLQDRAEPAPKQTRGSSPLHTKLDIIHTFVSIYSRVGVEWKVVIEFNYSWMVQLLVNSIFSASVSAKRRESKTWTSLIRMTLKY